MAPKPIHGGPFSHSRLRLTSRLTTSDCFIAFRQVCDTTEEAVPNACGVDDLVPSGRIEIIRIIATQIAALDAD